MTEHEAALTLESAELVPVLKGSLAYLKEVRDKCLAADVPVAMGCPDGKTCGTTTHLLIRQDDVPRLAEIMRGEWDAMVEREGTAVATSAVEVGEDEDLPCPACGTQAPLQGGACSDCGLVLE